MAQRRHDPALDSLHRVLDLRFVPRLQRTRGDYGAPVMLRPIRVGLVHIGFVTMRRRDGCLRIIRHHDLVDAAEELHRTHMRTDPILQAFGPRALGEGVVARALRRDEYMNLARFTRLRIRHRLREHPPSP